MEDYELFLSICNDLGTISFALSGVFKGIRKRLDVFGITLLAIMTACGGGIIRDMIVDQVPNILKTPRGLYISIITSLIVCLFTTNMRKNMKFFNSKRYQIVKFLTRSNLILDSIGLAIFAIIGAHKSVDLRMNVITAGILATLTGVGGGMIRDILVAEIPSVLKEDIYAVLAFLVGIAYHIAVVKLGYPRIPTTIVLFSISLIIRLIVIKYKMNLPKSNYKSI